MSEPLVIIGIPTFNRPEGLRRTLGDLCAQTYRHIEIVVSDNASPGSAVRDVVDEFAANDARVSYHRHPENVGAMRNFSSLVLKARGEFFMWAADDDRWEPFFVERCVQRLVADPGLAVCQMEAQYEVDGKTLFPFFFEGSPFNSYSSRSPFDRVKHLLRHVYGNLVYGVFRREALFHEGKPITEWIGRTLNEIPMQILLASWGNIRVIPEIGLYKSAPRTVCEQARWEQVGGWLPNWRGWWNYLTDCRSLHQYHEMVMHENFAAIDALGLDSRATGQLRTFAAYCLLKHEFLLALRWKPVGPEAPQPTAANPVAQS
ncbi:glycosyltransferase involved in cell wall biosynthesis [Bradyrhizobium sp. cir1]|uniref:glycosyltransferase family 2 protein n=1 Tax=Bradyrhizobium sp. cir1 TaxID=1445730 RepID=UPI001605CF43|nr:glycosyltransferase family 2 protein [Bradyrhizobium sp. cir1]MBB4368418.1 glycosyltransferase involved in cell wall biosynthesis [Bradyrhizobium sp. cir1]